MIFVVLRVVIVMLALWVLWKLYTALFPARRPPRARAQDEWGEVLEAIDELPETTEPHRHAQDNGQPLQNQPHQSDDARSPASIESVIVQEAEVALSLIRQGDEHERLAAYHEITTYAKLCTMADCHISEATCRTIDAIRQQAWEIICPPESD